MKKIYFVLSVLLIACSVSAQNTYDPTPPFKRFPSVPPFHLLAVDSVTIFTKDQLKKNKPVMVMYFNPDCEHCKHLTEEIIKHIDDLKKVQIVMAAWPGPGSFGNLKTFYSNYKIGEQKNIHIGHDFQDLLRSFYRVQSFPFLAMYDKKGNLITTFEGSMKIENIIKVFD